MKKLFLLVSVLVTFLFVSISTAADKDEVQKFISDIQGTQSTTAFIHENTGKHDHFRTSWKEHYATLIPLPGSTGLQLIVRDYQDYYTVHNACGFIIIIVSDLNADGVVDKWHKSYFIKLNDSFLFSPSYPPGYLNYDWSKMTLEEAQIVFDMELKYQKDNASKAELW